MDRNFKFYKLVTAETIQCGIILSLETNVKNF